MSPAEVEPSRRQRLAMAALTAAALVGGPSGALTDPDQVVGPQTCQGCHRKEYEVWQGTAHARLFESEQPLHTRSRAQEIAKNLGVPLIKHDSLCLECHFTPARRGARTSALAGVSCESCHGGAAGWLTVHNTIDGSQASRRKESPPETSRREERNASLGMRFPGRLYDLLSSCYGCHLVPDEKLVNEGKHSRGGDFDVVERFDRVRHDFVSTGYATNAALSPARKRQYLVAGVLLTLEHALRNVAAARNDDGAWAEGQLRRVEGASRKLRQLERAAEVPEIAAALAAAAGLKLPGAPAAEILHAADLVAAAGRTFTRERDADLYAGLDSFLAGDSAEAEPESAGKSGAAPAADPAAGRLGAPPEAEADAVTTETETAGTAPAAASDLPSAAVGAPPGAVAARRASVEQPEGKIKDRIREPLSEHGTVGQSKCDACHADQNGWWYDDRHFASADAFLNRDRRALQIARVYYGRPVDDVMATGRVVCMDCHGTVTTGKEAREVDSGVSCESCHGPASSYLKPHPEAPRAQRLAMGITDLELPERRARVCTGCHYIADARLLSSGHRPGSLTDWVDANRRIQHWKGGQPEAGALAAAYREAIAARGARPTVRVVSGSEAAGGTPASAPAGASGAGGTAPSGGAASRGAAALAAQVQTPAAGRSAVAPGRAPAPRPRGGGPAITAAAPAAELTIVLPPLPEDASNRSLEALLLLVQERLDTIRRQLGGW